MGTSSTTRTMRAHVRIVRMCVHVHVYTTWAMVTLCTCMQWLLGHDVYRFCLRTRFFRVMYERTGGTGTGVRIPREWALQGNVMVSTGMLFPRGRVYARMMPLGLSCRTMIQMGFSVGRGQPCAHACIVRNTHMPTVGTLSSCAHRVHMWAMGTRDSPIGRHCSGL